MENENIKKPTPEQVKEAKEILRNAGYIPALWHKCDIEQQAEEMEVTLTPEQVDKVVTFIENDHDANTGINWDSIEFAIESVLRDE